MSKCFFLQIFVNLSNSMMVGKVETIWNQKAEKETFVLQSESRLSLQILVHLSKGGRGGGSWVCFAAPLSFPKKQHSQKFQNLSADICTPVQRSRRGGSCFAMSLRLHRNEEFLKIKNSPNIPQDLFADICRPAQCPPQDGREGGPWVASMLCRTAQSSRNGRGIKPQRYPRNHLPLSVDLVPKIILPPECNLTNGRRDIITKWAR